MSGTGIPTGREVLNNLTNITDVVTPPQVRTGFEALKAMNPELSDEYGFGRVKSPEELLVGVGEAPVKYIKRRKHISEPVNPFDFRRRIAPEVIESEEEEEVYTFPF